MDSKEGIYTMNIDAQAMLFLLEIYERFGTVSELTVTSSDYDQQQIDYLIHEGLLSKIDTSTLSGWSYIVKPTYEGKKYVRKVYESPILIKIIEFVKRGEDIRKKEYHPAGKGFLFSYIGGPLFNTWMDEINIFNERYLKDHPLHDQIYQTYFHRRNRTYAYDDMMGHLRALFADNELLEKSVNKDPKTNESKFMLDIDKMMRKDIDRCKAFFDDSKDEVMGRDLYIDITNRYDHIIPDFGAGLYKCIPEQHWYDPEISGDTLLYNLKSIMNRMIAFQAGKSIQRLNEDSVERKIVGEQGIYCTRA